ncbi:uncharacterized protein LOC124647309 [Lolium rigidum]|uniref:uncharacterized protein LOC124647309 n=1 Tax=Lolium rigidum TaxID=89674 RepID=UPI001F5C3C22|nr:uncharacterized protein LOC124647309 [Lolium rigidum]
MARSPRGPIRRRRPAQAARREDRISALPDDLLLLLLRKIDTHAALGAGTLSRRWAHLPRQLPDLDFRVGDILSPRYHKWLFVGNGSPLEYGRHTMEKEIRPNIRRFERRAMRSLVRSVESFLDAGHDGRRVNRLRLEFFTTHNTACINRLLAKAIDVWGAVSLEAVAKPIHRGREVHVFPSHGLCVEPRASRLRSLKLGGCVLPPLHEYSSLSTLVLQDMPGSTPGAAYEGVFTSCPQLQVLHLISCQSGDQIIVDAPRSQIRELVLDKCEFMRLCMRALPYLERLASLGTRVLFESASFACLSQYNLTLGFGHDLGEFGHVFVKILKAQLGLFFGHTMEITNLVIRFTGPGRWIVPSSSPATFLPNLRQLLVADVPSSWDVSWPRLLLETAPSLHTFHVHVAPSFEEPGDEIPWQPTILRHDHLKEFMMVGFQAMERQLYLVKFVVEVCTALCHVALFKDGHVRDKGHWDWGLVTEQYSWTQEEKAAMLNQIMDGVSSSSIAPSQLVFG